MSRPESGLTPEEQAVADLLVEAWNRFNAFEDSIDLERYERFRAAIHDAQGVLMERIVRRLYPEYWR